MKRVRVPLVMEVCVSAMLIAAPARAETLLIPWLGANAGSRDASTALDVGVTAGTTAAGVIGVDVDFGYSPDFFGNNLTGYLLTTMGNVTVGVPFDGTRRAGIRPYVTGGIGLIRARIDSPLYGYSLANTDVGVNAGGGLTAFLSGHVDVRADLRYVRSVEDDNWTTPFGRIDVGRLRYWRTSVGVVLR